MNGVCLFVVYMYRLCQAAWTSSATNHAVVPTEVVPSLCTRDIISSPIPTLELHHSCHGVILEYAIVTQTFSKDK
jgi:hypothetical protein